jgi:PIN domain nuclease of toxin-antitoxin system
VGVGERRPEAADQALVILLDTNAVIWLDQNHRRVRTLARSTSPLLVSPATLLELQMLDEAGRLRLRTGLRGLIDSERWKVDEPPALQWFERSAEESWTRDPFDRLIVAHARLRRIKLASGDGAILERLRPSERIEL